MLRLEGAGLGVSGGFSAALPGDVCPGDNTALPGEALQVMRKSITWVNIYLNCHRYLQH